MAVLSVMSIRGNPDDLLARMQQTIEPVAVRKAPIYGGISSTVVRTDDGIAIYNLWSTDDGRHRMADDPEVRAAVEAAGFPTPAFAGYDVISRRTLGDYGIALSRRMIDEVWNGGKVDVIEELYAPEYAGWSPTDGETRGPAGIRAIVERYRGAFSDVTMTADSIVAADDWVTTRWTGRGTHTGDLMGIPPTGKEVTVGGIDVQRVEGGMFVEGHGVFDALGMLQQLGAVPAGAPAHA